MHDTCIIAIVITSIE